MLRLPMSRPSWGLAVAGCAALIVMLTVQAIGPPMTVLALTYGGLCAGVSAYTRLPVRGANGQT